MQAAYNETPITTVAYHWIPGFSMLSAFPAAMKQIILSQYFLLLNLCVWHMPGVCETTVKWVITEGENQAYKISFL